MRERREQSLKLACLVFGALLVLQLARFVVRANPGRGLAVPAVPSLPITAETNAAAGGTNATGAATPKSATNSATAQSADKAQTNSAAVGASAKEGTNPAPVIISSKGGNNVLSHSSSKTNATNLVVGPLPDKNASNAALPENSNKTNSSSSIASEPRGTNNLLGKGVTKEGTNSPALGRMAKIGGNAGQPPLMGPKPPDLPPLTKARIDRITQSEILGSIIRPLPMALLGIAGKDAFLRAPNGQTGLVKEGDELGGVKLLIIGTNRVLVEHEGQKKELTVFAGFGSETLLPKEKEKPQ